MKANEQTWTASLDPEYSVLGLPHGLGRDGARYLDVATGWQESRRIRAAFEGASPSRPAEVTPNDDEEKSP
jgi:hypothetical protein